MGLGCITPEWADCESGACPDILDCIVPDGLGWVSLEVMDRVDPGNLSRGVVISVKLRAEECRFRAESGIVTIFGPRCLDFGTVDDSSDPHGADDPEMTPDTGAVACLAVVDETAGVVGDVVTGSAIILGC